MAILQVTDLLPFAPDIDQAKAAAMVEDTTARAVRIAPCLDNEEALSESAMKAAKAILRDIVLRWNDVGSGARTTRSTNATTGPYGFNQSETLEPGSKVRFFPSEIRELQALCSEESPAKGKAFSVNMIPGG